MLRDDVFRRAPAGANPSELIYLSSQGRREVTDRLEIDRLLRRLHGARVRGDLEALLATFADDVSLRIAGASDGKPIAVTAKGIDQARPWLSMLIKSFRLTDYALLSLLIDGREAAAHWQVTIHSKITGTVVPTELVDLVEVRDDKIASYTEFFSPRPDTSRDPG